MLAVALPGYGYSEGVLLGNIKDLAQWGVGIILSSVELKQTAVVSNSMGSLIVMEEALQFPCRISKLASKG